MQNRQVDQKSLVDELMIAAPCNIGWENMTGDDRVRFCGGCAKSVYNTSVMTTFEIEKLVSSGDGSHCLRIYRRADGTLITGDCPVGLRTIRQGWWRVLRGVAAAWAGLVALAGSGAMAQPTADAPVATNKGDVPADRAAFDSLELYRQAKFAAENKRTDEAISLYRQATEALFAVKHDPKFERTILREYEAFLKRNKKTKELAELQPILKTREALTRKFTFLPAIVNDNISITDGVPYDVGERPTSSKVERHQLTSPTLPNGAPVPENE